MELRELGHVFEYSTEKEGRIIKPTTSIVIPSYNAEDTLPRAVISSLTQDTSINYNIVIIDDGSKINVKKCLESICNDDRITIHRQDNKGRSMAMNLGFLLSGKYVIRLDADDELLPEAVQILTNNLESNSKTVCAYSDGFWIGHLQGWEWEEFSLVNPNNYVNPWIKREFSFEELLNGMYLGHASIFTRESFIQVGGYNPEYNSSGEDWDFALKLSEVGDIQRVPRKLHKYHLLNTGATNITSSEEKLSIGKKIVIESILRRGLNFSEIPQKVISKFRLTKSDIK
ncbi:glycosyltransferase [archaeon]|nr:glycosyltransferase [archaeon]